MPEALASPAIGRFADLHLTDRVCRFGPEDRAFEERHAAVTVAVVVEGTFQYRVGKTPVTLTPGSVILGSIGQDFVCSHEHGRGDRCVAIDFTPQAMEDIARTTGAREARFHHATLPGNARHVAAARMLLGAGDAVPPSAEEVARALAADILRSQSERPRAPQPVTWAEQRRAVAVCRLMDERAAEPLSLGELAAHARLSPFHFLRSFKRALGVTPHQYLIQTRLGRAAALLLDTDRPVTDVAYEAGFADLANFNRSFRQTLGCTPGEMRRRKIRKVS